MPQILCDMWYMELLDEFVFKPYMKCSVQTLQCTLCLGSVSAKVYTSFNLLCDTPTQKKKKKKKTLQNI